MASAFAREGGYGGAVSVINNDSPHDDRIIVPDEQLLFAADFSRTGPDLILTSDDGRHYIIPGYFASANRPTLVAPNGASLPPDLVALRAESPIPGAYPKAQPIIAPDSIGRVTRVDGNAVVIRNGVAVALKVGDEMFKSDVIETGIDGLVALVFVDGTTFYLSASGRMVLDEFVCSAEKSSNSAQFRVVKGLFGFIAGKVATTGRLIIDTPLSQIQCTTRAAGFGSLAFSIFTFGLIRELKAASADIALLDNGTIDYKDLKHGVFEIITKEAHPRHIVVDDPGETIELRLNGSGTVSVTQVANTPVVMAQYQSAYQSTHDNLQEAQPFINNYLQEHANATPTNNPGNNTNTASTTTASTTAASPASTGSTGSSTPDSVISPATSTPLIAPVQNNNATPSIVPVPAAAPVNELANNSPTTTTQQLVIPPPLAPAVTATNTLSVKEDGTLALGVSETPSNPSDTVIVTIAGVPSDATLSAGTNNNDGSWTLTPAQLTGLNFTAGEVMPVTLTVTATTTNPEGTTASTSQSIPLIINPVAPTLTAPTTLTVNEDGTVALGISETPFDARDTVSVTITGVPSDATLSAGTKNSDGSWTLTPAQLTGLNFTAGEVTHATLTVTATNTEGAAASTSQTIPLTVNPVAPTLAVPATLTVAEDGTVALGITEAPFDARDTVSVTITGVPSDAALSAGTKNNDGSWTVTPAQLTGLNLTAGEVTHATLTVTATNTEGATASTSQTIPLTVNPVAPTLAVPTTLTVTDYGAVALGISETPFDARDTVSVTITGVPSDATLSAGIKNNDGSWTLTPAQLAGLNLTAGEVTHATLTITATNTEGTTASTSQDIALTVNPVAPAVAITGTGGPTNQTSQLISGTVTETNEALVSGTTVDLYDNGSSTALGTATVQSNGSWSTTVTLAAGANSIVAKDTDLAGNSGSSAAVVYTLDTTAPAVAITGTGGSTNQASQLISGTVTETNEALVSGTTVDLYDNGSSTALGTATVQSNGSWSTTVTLAAGANSIVAKDTDLAGNSGSSAAVVYTLDTTAPAVAITGTGGPTNQASQLISGTVTETNEALVSGTTVDLYDNGSSTALGTATVQSNGSWSTTVTLAAGANSIVAKDTDLAGNSGSSAAVVYTLDTTAPAVAITGTGGPTNQASQLISGTVTETNEALVSGTTVDLYDNGSSTALGTATVQSNGSWSTTVTLAAGANSIVAKDTDLAGNSGSSVAVVYTLDTTAPAVAITGTGGPTNQASQLISGTVTETNEALVSGTTVDLYDNGSSTALGTATVQSNGSWSTTVTLAAGANSIVAKDTDLAGNSGSSAAVVYTLDTTAPAVAITGTGGSTNQASQLISGTVTETNEALVSGTTVDLYDNGSSTALGTATVQSNGSWSTTVTLAAGANSIVAKDTDLAGNSGSSAAVVYTGVEHWVGMSADWSTPSSSDWNFTSPPNINVDTVIDAPAGTYTVTITSADTAKSLTVNDVNATVLDENGGSLTLNGSLTIDAGTFELSGSGALSGETSITNAGIFEIAGADTLATSITNTNGTVQVEAGDTLTLSGASISGGTIELAQGTEPSQSVAEISAPLTTYVGTRSFDGATVQLSITTDDVDGAVAGSNIISWNIVVTDAAGSIDMTPANSQVYISGNDLTATPSALSFNFSGGAGGLAFQLGTFGWGEAFYGVESDLALFDSGENAEGASTQSANPSSIESVLQSGNQVLATATATPLMGFDSVAPAVSDNGEFTAFLIATNSPENINNINIVGVGLYDSADDQLTDISALVSSQLPNDLHPGENFGSIPSISADGQYVVFEGQYQVENFNNGNGPTAGPYSQSKADIFLYNIQSQTVTLVYSATPDNGNPVISGNGQFIAATIMTQNSQDQPSQDNVVVTNDSGAVLTQISGDPNFNFQSGNTFGDPGAVEEPDISSNGQFVSFWSTASEIAVTQNGVTSDFFTGNTAETTAQVYVYDRVNNTLQEVSVSNAGVPGNANSGGLSLDDNGSDPSSISVNGTYVVFQSSATNLVPGSGAGDQNGVPSVFNVSASNVYLYDTQTNTIQLVSAGLNGAAANGASYSPEISADGDYVVFESTASNLVAGGSGGQAQTYIYNTQTGTIELVSAAADGLPADSESDYLSSISADGSVVAFGSSADNLAPTDTDGTANIYLVDLNQTTSSSAPSGAIDVTADAAISDATLDGGTVTVVSGVTLTLNDTTVSGTTIAVNGTLDFTGSGTLDNVSLTGGQITVASGQLVTLDDVTLNNTALTVDGGTTPSIQIDAGQWLVWAGTVTVGGPDAIIIDDNGQILHTGTLDVTFPMQTFDGSGTDTFNGNVGSGSATIVNDGITFDGYGGFGGSITLINNVAGTIDADVSADPFILDTSQTITNAGTFEATNGATLLIENGSVTNTGMLQAEAESQVDLSNETISGGTLTGSGLFDITGSSTINGNAALSDGVVEVESGQTLAFGNATVSGSTIEAITAYSFATVNDPSAATSNYNFNTQNIAINNTDEVVGNYGDANRNFYGFIYSVTNGTYTTVSDPFASQGDSLNNLGTTVTSINDSGEVAGYYNNGSGDSAFVESGGEYTTLSQGGFALGINNSGEIVGVNYVGNNDSEGFLYNNGVYTNLNDGLAGQEGTYSFAINNSDQVLGDYYDANDDVHGFIYNIITQIFTDISDPSAAEVASGGGVHGTHAEGFNDAGQVVGYYVDASGAIHGFLYNAGTYTTLDDPAAVNGTVGEGINDAGEVVGYYLDAEGNTQVFTYSNGVYTDVNDPSIDGGGIQDLSINDAGQIVGTYDNGELQGFLANPLTAAAMLQIATGGTLTLSGATIIGVTITNNGEIDVIGSSAIEGADPMINDGTLLVNGGIFDIAVPLIGNGADTIEDDSTLELAAANGQSVTYAGTGGTLLANGPITGGSQPGISATTSTGAALTITINGVGAVTSTGADAIDATNSGGGGNISITASGAVTGANDGINAIENGSGSTAQGEITIGGSGKITGQSGYGILAEQNASGLGDLLIDGTGSVTGTGSTFDGILAEILNTADVANVTVDQTGNVTGGLSGINAFTDGTGNVSVTTGSNATITGTTLYGIQARSFGTGSILVATAPGDSINSASAGIVAINRAAVIPQVDGSTASTVTVNAYGNINSGATLTDSGSRPDGILAGYAGETTGSGAAAPGVFGNVFVNNFANITSAAGDGIAAGDYGNGNVTVNDGTLNDVMDGPGTTIDATVQYGIFAFTPFAGDILVSTSAGDSIISGGTGILAVSQATAISASADSTITVETNGTIVSGSNLDTGGQTPGGIKAGYTGGATAAANLSVTGDVIIDNSANITAAAGWGLYAFNYGNGNVTVNDSAQTTVSGPIGIAAYQESGGTGDVDVTLAAGVSANTGAVVTSTASYGIEAYSNGTGNVSVITGANDVINSSSSGIEALNGATAIPETGGAITSTITVTAYGTINSGSTLEGGSSPPAGIGAAYKGASSANTPNLSVFGDITIDDYANITASAGYGIKAFDYGQGNITVQEFAGTIKPASGDSLQDGILAEQESAGSGNITILIDSGATVTGNTGTSATVTGTGTITITNYGTITGTTGQAIALSVAASDTATIENYGTINGTISLISGATVYNNAGATWNASSLADSGSVVDGGILNVTGAITGTGSVTIGNDGILVLGTSDAGIIAYSGAGGTLKFDQPAEFTGTIEALVTGDTIDLANTVVTSAVISGSMLTVTESNDSTLTYSIAGSLTDNAFTIGGDGQGGTDLTLEQIGYLWGTAVISEPSEHLYGPFDSSNGNADAGIIIFGATPVGSYQAPPGPDNVTEYVALADPFFLPYDSGPVAIDAGPSVALPFKNKIIYPNLTSTTQEAIAVYETDNGSDPVLNREIITDPSGPNGQLSVTSDPFASQPSQAGTIYNLDLSSSGSPMTSYAVAWDLYNAQTDSYSIFLAVFNASNAATITEGYESILSQTGVTSPSSEVWEFKEAGGLASSGFPFATVMAQSASGGIEDIAFQAYSTTGTKSDLFLIAPNIATGATNQIINPDSTSQTALVFTPNAVTGSGFSVAWNETVTESNGTKFNQVEFAIFKPNVSTGALTYVLSPITFQVPDAQNVKIGDYSPDGVTSDEFLAYGDATSTTMVEFNVSGQIIATATELSPTGQVFDGFDVSSDGLVSLTFGTNTSQYATEVYDFRTTGLNETLSTAGTNYIAGTQYTDVVTGAPGADNFYYYVGENTGGLPNTTGPSDTFDGGNTTNWNLAVFADARSDYSIAPSSGSGFTITYTNPADLHSGNLTVDGNVQALVFEPSQDPTPTNNVFAVTNGETLILLHPSSFSGEISGPSPGVLLNASDIIDLYGFDAADTTATPGSYNGTTTPLTVHDSSDSATVTLTLVGNYSTSTWTVTTDNNGGADLVDPPPAATIATGAALELNAPSGETVTFAGGTGSLILDNPSGFTGQIVGFTGTAPDAAHSDTIDLVGINYDSPNFNESYDSSTGLLTVSDGSNNASITFDNFNATLDFASDGNGGTLITDPPTASDLGVSVQSSATADGASGSITFADDHGSDTQSASFTPDSSDHFGHFSLGALTQGNGAASVEFDFNKDQITPALGQTLTQSYNVSVNDAQNPTASQNQTVSVSIGGPGNDHFVFAPGIGADTITNFQPQQDTIALDHFANAQSVQELQSLITEGAHGDAVINLGHNDSVTLAGVTDAQLQQVIHAGHVLLH